MKKIKLIIAFIAMLFCLAAIAEPEFKTISIGSNDDVEWKLIFNYTYDFNCRNNSEVFYQDAVTRLIETGDFKYLKAFSAVWYKNIELYIDPTALSMNNIIIREWLVSCLLCNNTLAKGALINFNSINNDKTICYPLLDIITNNCSICNEVNKK